MCLPTVELLLQAEIRLHSPDTSIKATVRIHTGSRFQLTFRHHLIADHYLCETAREVRILTADNSPMTGGKFGTRLTMLLCILTGIEIPHLLSWTAPLFGDIWLSFGVLTWYWVTRS
jgi:hypothetical protein